MVANILTDVRNELDEDLQHPVLGYVLLGLATGLGVLATGEALSSLEMPEPVVLAGIIIAAGAVPTFTWYALRKLGF